MYKIAKPLVSASNCRCDIDFVWKINFGKITLLPEISLAFPCFLIDFLLPAFPPLFHHESSVNLDTDDKTLSMSFPNYKRNYRNLGELRQNLKGKFNGNSANAKFELRSVLYHIPRKSHSVIFITESNEET